jgi:hypothetical protein
MNAILLSILFFVVFFQLPLKEGLALLGRWYFMGTLWLSFLSIQGKRYVEEKRKTQSTDAAAPEIQRDTNP